MNKRIILLVLFAFSMSSCKKWQHQYPEDEERSKLTPMERLTSKTWVLSNVTLNGVDYTDTVYNQIGQLQLYFSNSEASGSGSSSGSSGYNYYAGEAFTSVEGGYATVFNFGSNNTSLNVFPLGFTVSNYNIFTVLHKRLDPNRNFKSSTILRLEENHLKLQFSNTENGGLGDTTIINSFILKQ